MVNALWSNAWSAQISSHLWQSTLLIFPAWVLTLALRRYRAAVRYRIWMAVSLKFLLPFSLLSALDRWIRPAGGSTIASSSVAGAIARIEQPLARSPLGASSSMMWIAEPSSLIPAHPHIQAHGNQIGEILFALWFCGVLVLLVRWLRAWREIRVTVRNASPEPVPFEVPVLVTDRMVEPGVVGLLRPVLLFPSRLFQDLPEDQLRAILAHEGCHVRRRDNLTGTLHMLVELIFWFHPAVWWIERHLIAERETACDEAVLQLGNAAEAYAESILRVCKLCTRSPLVCTSGVTGSELKQRILRIMTNGCGLRLRTGQKLLLSAVAAAVLSVPMLSGLLRVKEVQAQSKGSPGDRILDTWQGTLHADRDSRFVVRITRSNEGSLRSSFYNLNGSAGAAPGFSTTFDGTVLKLDFGFATYDGTLAASGNSIEGRWHQGPNAQPLIFLRATPATAWEIPSPPAPPTPMAANVNPEFEIATIKPSTPEERGPRFMFDHCRFSVVHVTLSQLVQFAYGVQEKEIAGAPDWVLTETFDITGQPGGDGEPSIKQWQAMVMKLTADRFQLRFHNEKREMPVFALGLAKSGPKFARSEGNPNDTPMLGFGPGNMGIVNATMAQVAGAMQQGAVDRPVVDQTGLEGRFDMRLRWTPADSRPITGDAEAPPDLFIAMQEQLGLRLVPTRAPVTIIVFDHVERPSAN